MKMFDPFSDRKARDIRNALSSALVAELCHEQNRYGGDPTPGLLKPDIHLRKGGHSSRHFKTREYRSASPCLIIR
jgi:hypothetical protein